MNEEEINLKGVGYTLVDDIGLFTNPPVREVRWSSFSPDAWLTVRQTPAQPNCQINTPICAMTFLLGILLGFMLHLMIERWQKGKAAQPEPDGDRLKPAP
jgi:hypothetical protein